MFPLVNRLVIVCLLVLVIFNVSYASILSDLFSFGIDHLFGEDDDDSAEKRDEGDDNAPSSCACEGPACNCCVEFNITTIVDLGGPGCVKLRYLSQDEGISLNISYGESVLHSVKVKSEKPKATCMDLLSEFAQLCTRFSKFKKTDEGLKGCLSFEPTVLGETTGRHRIGCFAMGPEGMAVDGEKAAAEAGENEEEEGEEEEDDEEEETTETAEETTSTVSLLEAVNQSAEVGIAFLSDLLGISRKNTTTSTPPTTDVEKTSEDGKEPPKATKGKIASFFSSYFF